MAGAKKKTARKNSNYKPVYKYVTADQLCRKVICDFRNIEVPENRDDDAKAADQNLYDTAVNFCMLAGIINESEKAGFFDGKNHIAVSNEEIAEFTGIPVHQIGKNLFAFKIRNGEDFVRVSMIRLTLCNIVNAMIKQAENEDRELTEDEKKEIAGYINFCAYTGLISDEQSGSLYMMMKRNMPLQLPLVASITGISEEVLRKMA